MHRYEIQEAKGITFKVGEMLDQLAQMARDESDVIKALDATRRQIEELDAALWYVEPQAVDEPIADTLEEYYL